MNEEDKQCIRDMDDDDIDRIIGELEEKWFRAASTIRRLRRRLAWERRRAEHWKQKHGTQVLVGRALVKASERERDEAQRGWNTALDHLKDCIAERDTARRERDEARAEAKAAHDAGWHEALDAVENMAPTIADSLRAEYPRPARPEGEKQNTHGWPSDENEWAKGMQDAMRPEKEDAT